MASPAFTGQRGPEELRGEITAIAGERIHISLSQQQWLPRAGIAVNIGEEMAGMFVPLKGKFVIIQVNADSCIAMAVGGGERGQPAVGMAAVLKTSYPNQPQSRTDYVNSFKEPTYVEVLQMAKQGHKMSQHMIASTYQRLGDHDNALMWWRRATESAQEPTIIQHGGIGQAKILAIRGEFDKALGILKNAASSLAPAANDMVFSAYFSLLGRGVESYVDMLKHIGAFYHMQLNNIEESKRWYRQAVKVMTTCATNGAPEPGDAAFRDYKMLLNQLVNINRVILEDNEAAVPWLKILAKNGDESAQKILTDLGLRW
jgi:tetratricopeptide (TPR) repeat protein